MRLVNFLSFYGLRNKDGKTFGSYVFHVYHMTTFNDVEKDFR